MKGAIVKRPSLAANVKAAAATEVAAAPLTAHAISSEAVSPTTGPKRSPSRTGRKAVYAWIDPTEHKRLKRLSLETGRSIDALVTEGISLLFDKHGA